MNYLRSLALFAVAAPLLAQYGGPAVMTRGQAPTAMGASQIDFRPYVSLTGGYDYGLNGVSIDPQGKPVNVGSPSIQLDAGISGLHSWRHTQLGLDYTFSVAHFSQQSYYDGINQTLRLGVTHQFSRHVFLSSSTSGGLFGQNFLQDVQTGLVQSIPFDPATTYIPANDFYDNRTIYLSSVANLVIQRSTRLSFSVGGQGFLTRRRSTALYGAVGGGAHGDVQYRITRRSTIGAGYDYTHYGFHGIFSSTDLHSLVGSYAVQLTKNLEFSATAGVTHYETKFIQTVPVDPAVAVLIGVTSTQEIAYSKAFISSGMGRFSYKMKRGVFYFSGGRSVTPGNGLFLTSVSNNVSAGYAYTALRKWSVSAMGAYYTNSSLQNFQGQYGSYSASLSASRQLMRYTHGVLSFQAIKYASTDFTNYNQWAYSVRVGLAFAPGDLPLRLW